MRRLVLSLVVLAVAASAASAHPPSSVEAKVEGEALKLAVRHPVGDPKDHYVSSVRVLLGDKVLFEGTFKEQSSREAQEILVPLKEVSRPAKLTVEANCNKWGSLKREIELQ